MNNSSEASEYVGSAAWLTVFSIIFIVIVSGNLLTIFAIAFNKQLSSVTANKFIYSLAISDLLVGLYIPYHVYFLIYNDTMGHTELYCIVLFMIPVFACSHSICKLLTIAVDRYIAIVYPLHYNRYMTKKVVWLLIIGAWVLTITWSTVPIYYNDWDGSHMCDLVNFLPTLYFNYMLTPLFCFAWFMMLIVYIKIWKVAYRHAKRVRNATFPKSKANLNDTKSFQVGVLNDKEVARVFIISRYRDVDNGVNESFENKLTIIDYVKVCQD
ncbi:hypothetical protein Zmor_011184 [Zophobas morio]|uniref:G-protein coupled receptors family 1 profile domain-containing protein n=1 Tax=Zophobas morio TaxID=2755281 RepID=A0AA38MKL5_9CUCU|nr:hypothetical protein Zmor_011184 [Zophobas morio]